MNHVAIIDRPEAARVALDPLRLRILGVLATPGSASSVAAELDLPRQKVNYHLRLLEEQGLVRLFEERPKRGLTERVMVAAGRSYAFAPEALGACSTNTDSVDRLSSDYLIALGARLVGEVGELAKQAELVDKTLPTLAIDTELTFASPAERKSFANDLAQVVAELVSRYHAEDSADGRPHRLVIGAHPIAPKEQVHD